LDIQTEPLSAGQIGFTHGVEDAGAEKIGRRVGLGACALSDRSDTDTREQIRMKAKLSTKGWERSRRADRNFALATIALGRREPAAFGHSLTRLNEAGANLGHTGWTPMLGDLHDTNASGPCCRGPFAAACLPTKAPTPGRKRKLTESVVDQEAE